MTADDFQYAQPADLGRCHRLMCELDGGVAADFLDRAGEERLIAKTRRLEDQMESAGPEQVFYQALMMALGSGPGKTLYYLLAKRTPLAETMDYAGEVAPGRAGAGDRGPAAGGGPGCSEESELNELPPKRVNGRFGCGRCGRVSSLIGATGRFLPPGGGSRGSGR